MGRTQGSGMYRCGCKTSSSASSSSGISPSRRPHVHATTPSATLLSCSGRTRSAIHRPTDFTEGPLAPPHSPPIHTLGGLAWAWLAALTETGREAEVPLGTGSFAVTSLPFSRSGCVVGFSHLRFARLLFGSETPPGSLRTRQTITKTCLCLSRVQIAAEQGGPQTSCSSSPRPWLFRAPFLSLRPPARVCLAA
ncbi:hypothetical protein BGZ61DRAFT_572211 [Ilyonectria robusta]|uniref:uncharacterized protein n=1 Tax=Ilyonectria robusta TaxID=1079257 RepID=UPI001E8DAAFC|nr:uncharacterized protein BGZ61DRAFT_572211 [Ilyonectria robusta]KAH8721994.1 hypothetical protein BGZ61DRAFT_572211 [Ilyonectria robusta]